ncbi:hypothetical protein RRG08_036681 [Elysia crispata]|uniref:Uncharacterized protein n=1 Tax=Elysia crispata TaxID=231223 RepID=A0AAE1AG05_9GAST|nr:hypothetical protein RRG08_036681 [Elysia crispata]
MFFQRWLARLRYKKRLKSLNKPFGKNAYKLDTSLTRAGKNKQLEALLVKKRKTIDCVGYPFVLPKGPQGTKRIVLYDTYYCIFPPPAEIISTTAFIDNTNNQESILMSYSSWLKKIRDPPLHANLTGTLKREDKVIVQRDTVVALNNFLITNKFVYGGHVLSADDDDGDPKVTLIYYRSQPMCETGIVLDPNLFFLRESQEDTTTSCHVSDQWVGEIVSSLELAKKGVDTDIMTGVPLDKVLYATVTTSLGHAFHTRQSHMQIE